MTPSPIHILASLMLLCLGETVGAQYLNRAVFLGRGDEGMRRDFDQNAEYYITRFSYLPAPWWKDGLDPFREALEYYVGSATSTDLTIEGRVHLQQPLGAAFAAHFHLLQSEHRDAQFLRNAVELEYIPFSSLALFALFEGTTQKEDGDISLGAYWRDADAKSADEVDYELRLMFTAVDFAASKSETTNYTTRPFGLMLSGVVGRPRGAQLQFELASQLPAELEELDRGRAFEIQRHMGRMETWLPLNETDWLLCELEAEYTEKRRTPVAPLDVEQERLRRDYLAVRAEWWRRFQSGHEFAAGVLYFQNDEDGYRENQPSQTLRAEREELYGTARGRIKLDGAWAIEPSLFAGYAEYEQFGGISAGEFHGFQGKAGAGLLYQFNERAQIMLNLTAEIDRSTFSGANLQFKSSF